MGNSARNSRLRSARRLRRSVEYSVTTTRRTGRLPWKTRSGAGREYCADSFDARAIGSHSVCGVCPPQSTDNTDGINAARLSERLEGFRGLVRPALARQPASSGLDGGGLYLGLCCLWCFVGWV